MTCSLRSVWPAHSSSTAWPSTCWLPWNNWPATTIACSTRSTCRSRRPALQATRCRTQPCRAQDEVLYSIWFPRRRYSARRGPMRKPMNRLWRLVVLLTLALALPLRAQAGPLDNCCIAGIAQMPAHGPAQAAQASVETGSPHDCVSQFGCAGDRHVSGPSRLPCTISACAILAGTPLATAAPTDAWTSVLVAHPEFAYRSVVPPRLERPPKRYCL